LYRKDAYKFFSALSPNGTICSIGTNLFSYICFNCPGMVDHKSIKISDIDLEFIATKAAGQHFKTKTNPDRQLIRYQFLEIFVRLALDKYYKTGVCRAYDDAIIKMFDENLLPYLKRFDS
jgi:NLR family CARD domain-containing protein 3